MKNMIVDFGFWIMDLILRSLIVLSRDVMEAGKWKMEKIEPLLRNASFWRREFIPAKCRAKALPPIYQYTNIPITASETLLMTNDQ